MTTPESDTVRITNRGNIRTIALNRPEVFNSLDAPTRTAFREALVSACKDSATEKEPQTRVRAVIITGLDGAFCTGQDLKELMAVPSMHERDDIVDQYTPLMDALLDIPVPVIAMIDGPAAGAGWGIAMACDFRIMTDRSFFKASFSSVGLALDCGLGASLSDVLGRLKTEELLMLDIPVAASQALELGLVNRVVDRERCAEEVDGFADLLASGATQAYKEIKASLDTSDIRDAVRKEGEIQKRLGRTEDFQAGVKAFAAKQKPEFLGQ